MEKIIDTHAHLSKSFYKENLNHIIRKTLDEIDYVINIGIDKKTIVEVIELSKEYKNLFSVIGIHPLDILDFTDETLNIMENFLEEKKVIAIGEIGLDYYRKPFDKEKQKEVFIKQIELATKYNLPIIIHARESLNDLFEIIKDYPNQKFLLHSWNKEWEETQKFLKLRNIWFGFNGIITFNSTKSLIPMLEKIPLDKIFFETDSPFLSPVPVRGKTNYPYNVKYVYEYFAKIRNIKIDNLEQNIIENFKSFFNIDLNLY